MYFHRASRPAHLHLRPHASLHLLPLLASNVTFAVLFGIFILALLTLSVIVLTWAFRRDRAGRAAWRQRVQNTEASTEGDVPPPAGP
jgi:hypothetical protein